MEIMRYKAVAGSRLSDEQAERYGPEIKSLMDKRGGRLDPDDVVEAARKKRSPLHEYFMWNDHEAAEEWRRAQARCLLRFIEIEYVQDDEVNHVRAFVSVPYDGERNYRPIEVVMLDEYERQNLIGSLREEIIALTNKLKRFEEFADIVLSIEEHLMAMEKT